MNPQHLYPFIFLVLKAFIFSVLPLLSPIKSSPLPTQLKEIRWQYEGSHLASWEGSPGLRMWHHSPLGGVMGTAGLDPKGRRGPFLVSHLGWESQRWAEVEEGGRAVT